MYNQLLNSIPSKLLDIFHDFTKQNVLHFIWKNITDINGFLEGESDLDLFIKESDFERAKIILINNGAIFADNWFNKTSNIYHCYLYIGNKIYHLHIYTRFITGESQIKSYDIPLLDFIDVNSLRKIDNVLSVLPIGIMLHVHLIREYIKFSSPFSLLVRFRDSKEYKNEYDLLKSLYLNSDDCAEKKGLDLYFSSLELDFMMKNYESESILVTILRGMYLRILFSKYKRFNFFKSFFKSIQQFILRFLNKLFYKKKKTLNNGGFVIAITGCDGAGKSTTTKHISDFLSKDFDVRMFQFGRPPCSFLTFIPRGIYSLLKYIKLTKKTITNETITNETITNEKYVSTVHCIYHVLIAYDRAQVLKKVNYFRGKGSIVIVDRWLSETAYTMDGVKIPNTNNFLKSILQKLESTLYSFVHSPDLIFFLNVSLENALLRNQNRIKSNKESDQEIIYRYNLTRKIKFGIPPTIIDMNKDISSCISDIKNSLWVKISNLN